MGVLYSLLGLFLVGASFITYRACEYNAGCVYFKMKKLLL